VLGASGPPRQTNARVENNMINREAGIAIDERCLVAVITRYLFLAAPQFWMGCRLQSISNTQPSPNCGGHLQQGAGGGSPEQMVERSSGLLLTTGMDTKLTIYEAAYLQLARYGGVPH